MNAPKFTPGPWSQGVTDNGRHWVHKPGHARGINAGNQADAALIAAAPELYEALHAVRMDVVSIGAGENAISDATREKVMAALAKAVQ